MEKVMPNNKLSYYQGGGGVNQPTPGQKKYKSDPAIVVQPRFEEPFYRNYDLYTIPEMENVGPGAGWHDLQNYKSVQDFLKDRREKLKSRYVADDSWQLDNGKRVKKNPNIQARVSLLDKIVKDAGPNYDYGTGLYENLDKYDSVEDFRKHKPKSHGALLDVNHIDFPIDDQVSPILSDSGSSYLDSIPISYQENYTAEPDQDNKGEQTLDFGEDLTNEEPCAGRPFESANPKPHANKSDKKIDLEELEQKYLTPAETDIYGLPDGVDSEDKGAVQTISTENPYYGITDSGRQMYEDKWNI